MTSHLDFNPVGSTFQELATSLCRGSTVGVLIEPGDKTAYRFLLAPCWEESIWPALGGGVGDGSDYLLVAPMTGQPYPIHRSSGAGYIASKTHLSDYTADVLRQFLELLWIEIDIVSEDSPSQVITQAGEH